MSRYLEELVIKSDKGAQVVVTEIDWLMDVCGEGAVGLRICEKASLSNSSSKSAASLQFGKYLHSRDMMHFLHDGQYAEHRTSRSLKGSCSMSCARGCCVKATTVNWCALEVGPRFSRMYQR